MFEPGIGPGIRSDRFGTWSLITLAVWFVVPDFGSAGLSWVPYWACMGATLGALGCGVAGLFVRDQRRAALRGLLKAAVPLVVLAAFGLFVLILASMNWE